MELYGYDFQANGAPVTGLDLVGNEVSFNYVPGSTLTCTLSDGTPFNIAPDDHFQTPVIQDGVVKLIRTAKPTLSPIVHVPTDPAPHGVPAGRTVILENGGALDDNFLAGHDSVVEIHGGTVGANFEAERSHVTVSGGVVGDKSDVFNGAIVTLSGGSIGQEFQVHTGGTLNIAGGQAGKLGTLVGGTINLTSGYLGTTFHAKAGSILNVSGGTVDQELTIDDGGTANISGGQIGYQFSANSGSHVNLSGGRLHELEAMSGSQIHVSGGNSDEFVVGAGAEADISGGSFGDDFVIASGTTAALHGLGFEVDGVPVSGLSAPGDEVTLTFTPASNRLLTGTLADGTPFAFSTNSQDGISSVKLVRSADLPPTPTMIQVPTDSAPLGVHSGQTLTLLVGGQLGDNFHAGRGSTVNVLGGTVGTNFEAFAAAVNIQGGQLGNKFDVFPQSQVNIAGGSVTGNLSAYSQSVVNVTGGTVSALGALSGAIVNVDGGNVDGLGVSSGSQTNWSGGTIGNINAKTGAALAVHGAHFKVDGVPVAGLQNEGDSAPLNLPATSVLTGTLADGTPFVIGPFIQAPGLPNGTVTLFLSAEPVPQGPAFQHIVDSHGPHGIGSGQTLLLDGAGQLAANFVAGDGSTLEINGGAVGSNLRAFGAHINLHGGSIGGFFAALNGADVDVTGGNLSFFSLYPGAHLEVRGGKVGNSFAINDGAVVDLYGTSFFLDNTAIPGLTVGGSLILSQRGSHTLTAILADGASLNWTLNALANPRLPFGISSQATLRLHLVPEPSALALMAAATLAIALVTSVKRPSSRESQ